MYFCSNSVCILTGYVYQLACIVVECFLLVPQVWCEIKAPVSDCL